MRTNRNILLALLAAVIMVLPSCYPESVVTTADGAVQGATLQLRITESSDGSHATARLRIMHNGATLRLERGEQLLLNDVPFRRGAYRWSSSLIAEVPSSETYILRYIDDQGVTEIPIPSVPTFTVSEVEVSGDAFTGTVHGRISPAPERGDMSDRITLRQKRGDLGTAVASVIQNVQSGFELSLGSARGNTRFGPGQAAITVERVLSVPRQSMHGLGQLEATVAVIREQVVTLSGADTTPEGVNGLVRFEM